ncbi:peptidyl-prolyl cis-trans isomerase, partial [Verrucomicrobia bacterium]|nr:peptidyl-prolyl cis-trans isomerase [Verrucomicrobiota bacterium]
GVMWLVLLVVVAHLAVTLLSSKPGAGQRSAGDTGSRKQDALRSLGVKLEEQGLSSAAAEIWLEYLNSGSLNDEEQARIWYRIGTVRQETGDFEEALAAFYRSEKVANVSEIQTELGQRVQKCLEGMGKFSALKHELSRRVGLGDQKGAEGGQAVAEIGQEKLTISQLDQLIEDRVDQQLSMMRGGVDPEQLRQQKEAMMKQFAAGDQRRQFLMQWISEELLFRKAMKENLLDDESVSAAVHAIQRGQLASLYMQKMMAAAMHISDSDIEDFYKANPKEFTQPRQVRLAQILVKTEEDAGALIKKLKSGADFAKLAKENSIDEATKSKGGEVNGWITSGGNIAGASALPATHEMIWAAKAGEFLPEPVKTDAGYQVIKVLEDKPETLAGYEESKVRSRASLTRRREIELQRALMEELKNEFDVVLHDSALTGSQE